MNRRIAASLATLALTVAVPSSAGAYELLGDWPTHWTNASGVEFGVKGNYQGEVEEFSDDTLPNGTSRFEDLQTWRRKEVFAYVRKPGVWELSLGFDFQAHQWVDNYFRLYTKRSGDFRVGQFKTPVGFEEAATSANATTFLERALPVQAINEARRIGADWTYERVPGWLFNVAAYAGGDLNGDNDGTTFAGRAVFNPVKTENEVIHVGVAASSEHRDDDIARVRARPEANLTAIRLVDSGNLSGTDRIDRFGVEGAWARGPFSVQGEYLSLAARRESAADYSADGYYVFGSWVVTGESRQYKSGGFGNVKPKRPTGAVELAVRYSAIDLDDGIVKGGRQHDWTLGANWYVGQHLKLQANYIRAFSDKGNLELDPKIVELRAQIYF